MNAVMILESEFEKVMSMSKEEIEEKALEILKSSKDIYDGDSVDVIKIAEQLGFAVGNAKMNNDMDGFIIVDENAEDIMGIKTNKLIGVNADRNLAWKRFIIAHEIAHYVLHYSKEKNNGMFAHREHAKGKGKTENDADFFAANLLLPKDRFSSKYSELKEKKLDQKDIVVLLSRKFIATENTVARRIEELNLCEE